MKKNHVHHAYRLNVPQGVADHTASLVHAFANELLLSFAHAPDQPTAPDHLRAALRDLLATADRTNVTPLQVGRLCVALWYSAAETVSTVALVPPAAAAPAEALPEEPEATQPEPKPEAGSAAGVTYPAELTEPLAEALSMEFGQLAEIADRLRTADDKIPTGPDADVVHALHFIIPFAIRDGADWKKSARAALPPRISKGRP